MITNRQSSLSPGFVDFLFKSSGGFLSVEQFAELIKLFENYVSNHYFTKNSEANLYRIINALFDKAVFLRECLKFPYYAETIIAVSSNSNYLTDIIVCNPEYLYWYFNNTFNAKKYSADALSGEIKHGLKNYRSFSSKINFIRSFKRRIIFRIGLNDILLKAGVVETTQLLSNLANSINKSVFELCYEETLQKHSLKKSSRKYAVLSFGKLGGGELNYSSDVDLMVIFDKNSKIGRCGYFEILSDSAQLFAATSTEISSRGYLYRIDFRLRPDGKSSPLVRTIHDTINYYETRGEEWERQMLIKMNFLCGSKSLFNEFNSFVRSFVYSPVINNSPLQMIARMKQSIERNSFSPSNVKTFAGGIRDIEFTVQALQLLNGRRNIVLQNPNTLETIDRLNQLNLLSDSEKNVFNGAYTFYRRIEHYLQLMNDTQTHEIPEDEEIQNKISFFFGFRNLKDFKEAIEFNRNSVRDIYNSVIDSKNTADILYTNDYSGIRFAERTSSEKYLKYLRDGSGIGTQKNFDAKVISLFDSIKPELLKYLKNSDNPDLVLKNMMKIIQSTKLVSVWYKEFEDVFFFECFLKLCEFSQYSVDLINVNSSLCDLLINRRALTPQEPYDLSGFSFQQIKFILAVQHILGIKERDQVSRLLSEYIMLKLDRLCVSMNIRTKYFLAGLGSFAAEEMSFFSDCDLLVVVDRIDGMGDLQSKFQDFLSEAKQILPELEIDFRLRPEGRSSPLVTDIMNYKKYLLSRAGSWELMSLLKIKFVSGNKNLFYEFNSLVKQRILQADKSALKNGLLSTYTKYFESGAGTLFGSVDIKKSRGGLFTIDYLIFSSIMFNNNLLEKAGGLTPQTIFDTLADKKEFSKLRSLRSSYNFLKKAELLLQNIFNIRSTKMPADKSKLKTISGLFGFKNPEKLIARIKDELMRNNLLFKEFIE